MVGAMSLAAVMMHFSARSFLRDKRTGRQDMKGKYIQLHSEKVRISYRSLSIWCSLSFLMASMTISELASS